MHGLVTGEDPRQRCGDLESKLENPLGFFESERLVETNDVASSPGRRWDRPPLLLHADLPPFLKPYNPTEALSAMLLSIPGLIKIRGCALHIPPICTFFCVVSPCRRFARPVSGGRIAPLEWLQP